jgi:hypothetical protein
MARVSKRDVLTSISKVLVYEFNKKASGNNGKNG